ncbi:unnamed protein product [Fusarium graminearum]|uniref:Uncharacterized protein n=1 Tax=Gibberella zeae TaxID=5518 RepID=A0A4E9EDB9_GIBZA|nr:unnamed protein product [Fusarium graminearum]CAF3636882.1 unnamed protein product [Fusarium graminearum]CAG1969559.1 unnamed protein product [Fusarium graminearum]CAG1979764.1 unnamed protein product [Fusarium graminearum]
MTAHFHDSLAIHLDDSSSQSCFVSASSELILTLPSTLLCEAGTKAKGNIAIKVVPTTPRNKFGCAVLRGIISDALPQTDKGVSRFHHSVKAFVNKLQ